MKEVLTPGDFNNKIFLAKYEKEVTAWRIAAYMDRVDILNKLLEWAKEVLTPEELINKLFLDKDKEESRAWHIAAYMGHMEILHILWEWANRY